MDEIAERAVQLGGVAEGTGRMVTKRSSLAEYPTSAVDGRSHVDALSSVLAAFGNAARKAIDEAGDPGDLERPTYSPKCRAASTSAVVCRGAPAGRAIARLAPITVLVSKFTAPQRKDQP